MIVNLEKALTHLNEGGILIYPTDTVYGLGCLPSKSASLEKLLNVKNRERQFIVITDDLAKLSTWLQESVDLSKITQTKPTTWLFNATDQVPEKLLSPSGEIAIRVVTHKITAALLSNLDEPLISTSANLPGNPPLQRISELENTFPFPILKGDNGNHPPSTIIRYANNEVIRP